MVVDTVEAFCDAFTLPRHPQQGVDVMGRIRIFGVPVGAQIALRPGEHQVEFLAVLVCCQKGDQMSMVHPLQHAELLSKFLLCAK